MEIFQRSFNVSWEKSSLDYGMHKNEFISSHNDILGDPFRQKEVLDKVNLICPYTLIICAEYLARYINFMKIFET